jgi:hypothetical protein
VLPELSADLGLRAEAMGESPGDLDLEALPRAEGGGEATAREGAGAGVALVEAIAVGVEALPTSP